MSLLRDLKRPFNAITTVIALISIVLSVYFYSNPRRDRGISFQKFDISRIYNSQSSTPRLRLIDENSAVVPQDVFVVAFVFWNSGSEPIEPIEVRRPLKIILETPARILDAAIVKETDPEVSRFRLIADLDPAVAAKREINLTWDHFDPNQGVKVQVIFASDRLATFSIEGAILGVGHLRDIGSFSATEAYLALGIPTVGAVVLLSLVVRRTLRLPGKIDWFSLLLLICLILVGAFLLMSVGLNIIRMLRPAAPL